jgi:2-amino-4-hydroxy-6-hydroxymethyldihydropteridine diphosphokinase
MIIIAYGANLPSRAGDPVETFSRVVETLGGHGLRILQMSSLWETSPVDTPDEQPWYVNAVMAVDTALPPRALLEMLLSVEAQFGRVRTFKNAAKSIDLDLICYHDRVIDEGQALIVPHPRMHNRAFVLLPLKEIAAGWTHPVSGLGIDALIGTIPEGQEARILKPQAA